MIRIAVCDDEQAFSNMVALSVEKAFEEAAVSVEVKRFVSSRALIKDLENTTYDLMFLDIAMPVFTGFEVAETVQRKTANTQIVFFTSNVELVYNTFEYHPFDFIRKHDLDNLVAAIKHTVKKYLIYKKMFTTFCINDRINGKTLLSVKDLIYIKSQGHYLYYYTTARKEPYYTRESLSDIQSEMETLNIIRTHSRYMVNLKYIERFERSDNTILLSNKETVYISRPYKARINQAYTEYRR